MACQKCPTKRVVDPPQVIYNDICLPQVVEVIHPIEIVNRYHCVPVPHHIYCVTVRDEYNGDVAEVSNTKRSKGPKQRAKR
jgi:hypothetical protein